MNNITMEEVQALVEIVNRSPKTQGEIQFLQTFISKLAISVATPQAEAQQQNAEAPVAVAEAVEEPTQVN